ncbi:hypothetical protein FHW69_001587 [Luteibacter sp. Sphag1AF]|uniref:hypothetical protein n=1 Tax=Luteibacter sp. Sphag1AF TaxID=2587031 RepID=UPI001616488E|nr:hypothetical protein [Luteibacter sp. Sphag1AF]MBB3226986.1 hypothetical protein [Luteibacter sp. Sphag1AF]
MAAAKSARDTLAQAKYGQAFTDFNSQRLAREQNAAATLVQGKADAGLLAGSGMPKQIQ